MHVATLNISQPEIPFKHTFAHAAAARSITESVLVTLKSVNGFHGYGEGCPRSYVTGENLGSCLDFFHDHRERWQRIGALDELKDWVATHQGEIDQNPAAWCAVETAFLDLLGKESGQSLESVLGVRELSGNFRYSAVLGTDNLTVFEKQLNQYASIGFTDYKVKMTGMLEEDIQKAQQLKAINISGMRIRVDANNLWKNAGVAADYLHRLQCPLTAIEEPLAVGDYDGARALSRRMGVPIVLDESFLRLEQFAVISDTPSTWIINIRVSKMGGILRALAVAEHASSLGIPIVIGAQVGETSILTRAALTVAEQYRDKLLAQEGAFGTLLLERDICDPPLMLGRGGLLSVAPLIAQPGLGLSFTV